MKAKSKTDPVRQLELIAQARRMANDEAIAMASRNPDPQMKDVLDQILRDLWELEQAALKRKR